MSITQNTSTPVAMACPSTRDVPVVGRALIDTLQMYFAESLFTDLDVRCREEFKADEESSFASTETFQLLLASVSPMLREALEGAAADVGGEERPCIIVPDMSAAEITEIHERLLFGTNDGDNGENGVGELVESCRLLGIDIEEYVGEPASEKHKSHSRANAIKRGKLLFMCTVCGKEYSSEVNFKKHVRTHTEDTVGGENNDKENEFRPVTTLSGRTVRQPGHFKNNLEGNDLTGEDVILGAPRRVRKTKFVCGDCAKNFSTKQALRNHELLHKNERAFACEECGKRFVTAGCLSNHVKTHDATAKGSHPCEHCDKSFGNASNLLRHVRFLHSSERNFPCHECGKRFKHSSSLSAHSKTHEGKREFDCDFCEKAFRTRQHLDVHLRIHTGERPFECERCTRRFVTNGQLQSHIKHRHVGVKAIRTQLCNVCGATFVKKHDLKVHVMKHTGDNPHKCEVCSKGFRSERHLVDHARTHTGEKPYSCQTCRRSFRAPGGLHQHFKSQEGCRAKATQGAYSVRKDKSRFASGAPLHATRSGEDVSSAVVCVDQSEGSSLVIVSNAATSKASLAEVLDVQVLPEPPEV